MNWLAAICIRRPVFATVISLVFMVFGTFGYLKLGVDRFPKVDLPIITITTRLPGAAPEEIETEVTDKIEEAVNTVSGIDELRSVSSDGISQVFVTFVLEKDIDVASQEVRDKINRILADLPKDIEQPFVEKLDPDASPVLTMAVSAPVPVKDISEYCDKVLRRQFESVMGVGQVLLVGEQKRQINVNLDTNKLRSYNLTVTDVARSLATQNLQNPGGTIKSGADEHIIRTLGRVDSVEEIGELAVTNRNGHTITIGDLGQVEDGVEEAESLSRFNETPTILLNIRKQSGTNTIEVVRNVKERLASVLETAPSGYSIQIVRDQSVFIEDAIKTVQEHLVLGSILAAVVVFLFLSNFRTTLISAVAIPTSVISAFAAIYFFGFTMNSITLLALTLSVGIVIDDAIVVLENIFRFMEEKAMGPFEAAQAATREIGLAVLTITLSLVAVFLPIAFMEGIVGRFMKSFGVTMSAAIMVSMLVSFSLTPMLASRFLRLKRQQNLRQDQDSIQPPSHGDSKNSFLYNLIEKGYAGMLDWSLKHRWVVMILVVALMATLPTLGKRVQKNFLPEDDQSEFEVIVRAPEGTSLEATQVILSRLARDLRQRPEVVYTIVSVAGTDQRVPNLGSIYTRLVSVSERDLNQMEIMDVVRREILPAYEKENLRISINPVGAISGGGMSAADIQFMIGGPDMRKLEEYAGILVEKLKKFPGAVDVDSSLIVGKPQYGVKIHRSKAADLGVSVADISETLRLLVAGDKASDYNEKGEQYEIHVRAESNLRNNLKELRTIGVPSSKLGVVPLEDVIEFEEGSGPAQINRLARARQVTLSANLTPGTSQQAVIDFLIASTKELNMGPDYQYGLLGRSKEMARAARGFLMVFIMAFVFAYLVMASQFESWLHPFTILLSFPLTLPFALFSLILFNQSLNIFSTLGILVLFAVVKKNSILQIDHTNQLREKGMPRHDAMMAANLDRLRPILMTTVAFVAGMIPLMVSEGAGANTNRAISSVVIGGQTLSLLLTLIAIPVFYSLFDDLVQLRLIRWFLSFFSAEESLQDAQEAEMA